MANVPQVSSPKSMRFVLARVGFVLAAFLLTLYFGRILLTRPPFLSDDEGTLLLALKHYFAGEHLYTQVTSHHGPFYYIVQKAVFGLLHLPVTYDAGRLVAYIDWVLSSVFGGLFIYRLSKSVTLASAACLATMWLERVLSFEPNHPEEVVLVLLTAGCLVSVNPSPVALMLIGAIGAALVFTKINIGILFLAAALIASVCVLPAGRLRNISGKLLIVAMVAAPMVLMHHFLSAWARGFCLIGILTGVSVVLAGLRAEFFSPERMRALQYIAIGALAAGILIVLETTVEGLPLSGLLYGVVLGPLHHPDVFSIPFVVTKKMALLAVVLFLGMAGLYWFPERWSGRSDWIGALKCLVGVLVVGIWVQRNIDYTTPPSFSFAFAPAYALLPAVLLPKMGARWTLSEFFPRIFVTALAATQMLQAFPVAGSQVNIGAAPFLLWAFVCIHDGAGELFDLFPMTKKVHRHISATSLIGVMLAAIIAVKMVRTEIRQQRNRSTPSSLAGSASLHLPLDQEMEFEAITRDVQTNCQILFTMPGMGHFNFWSGVPTPDGFNMDAWMKGVPPEQQQHTLQILENNPSACVIYRPFMMGVWGVPEGGIDTLPLAHYILHDMPTVFARGGYEIRVSPDRRAPWVERSAAGTP